MDRQTELRRDLGFWGALTIGAGTMIGAGIFLLAGVAIERAGPAALLSYTIAGIICLLTAASAAELATGMPTSGGDYYFVSRSLGPMLGAVSGVGIWLSLTVAIAFYLVGTGEFLAQITPLHPLVGALAGAVLLTILNVVGAKVSGSAQIVIVVALVGILGIFIAGGAAEASVADLTPFFPEGGGAVLATTALVFVSFLGFVKIAAVAEEVKDPARNLPRTLMGSVVLVTILYVLIVLVIAGLFTQETIRDVPDPLTRAARTIFGSIGGQAIIVAGLFATLSSANASILASSRINLAMSRDGLFPEPLARIQPRFVTPARAILLTATIAAVLIVALPNIEELAKIASSLQLYSYAAINVGCVALRAADPPWYRPTFRVPGTPAGQIVGAIGCLTIIGFSGLTAQLAVVGLIVVSLGWYAVRAREHVEVEHALPQLRARWNQLGLRALFAPPTRVEIEEQPTGEIAIAPMEHIVGPDQPRRVMVALANPETEASLLSLARWIATGTEGGHVLGLHLVDIPRQTPLDVARQQSPEFDDARTRMAQAVAELPGEPGGPSTRPLGDTEVDVTVDGAHDIPSGLVGSAVAGKADLLVLGWHGGFSVGRIARTPVRRVVSELPADLAVLKDRGLTQLDRILVPWGGGRHARLGLELAARIAAATGAQIDLLRAVRHDVDPAKEERTVRSQVRETVADVPVEVIVEPTDDVSRTISEVARSHGHDLIIIGASGESRLRSVLFGTVPDVVADDAPCSVLLVRRYVPEHWAYRASEGFKRLREKAGLTTSPDSET